MSEFEDLRNDNRLLNLILDSTFGNVFVANGKGRIIYVNENAVQALGVSREKLLSLTIYEMVEQNISRSAASITALETRQECFQSVLLGNGGMLAVNAKPLLNAAGEVEYVTVFSQNHQVVKQFLEAVQQENLAYRTAMANILVGNQMGGQLVAESPATKRCLDMASRVARLDSTIMLYGESGTGKEVFASFIHRSSSRAKQMFLPVNCAAIPQELMESEFFGYEKGAFTGSRKDGKAGLFEVADGGTLFLDEIGELNLPMQSKLLRVLESGEIMRVGGTRVKKLNVRIIGATNRDLRSMADKGLFRPDLFYRLNVIPITIPPLRERREDTEVLATDFLERLNKKYFAQKHFSQSALEVLVEYGWPGNVRELKNVIERIFVIEPDEVITDWRVAEVLGMTDRHTQDPGSSHEREFINSYWNGSLRDATERFQRGYIAHMLRKCDGNVQKAAEHMGVGRSSLYKKLDRLGVQTEEGRKAP